MSNNRNGKKIHIQGEGSRRKNKEFDHTVKIEEESSEGTPSRAPPPPSLSPPTFTISSIRTPVTNVESVEISPHNLDPQQPYVKPEETSSSMLLEQAVAPLPPPPSPLPIYINICSICLGTMVEETATECGHLFCSRCIRRAFSYRERCPECRRTIVYRRLRRIFFRAHPI